MWAIFTGTAATPKVALRCANNPAGQMPVPSVAWGCAGSGDRLALRTGPGQWQEQPRQQARYPPVRVHRISESTVSTQWAERERLPKTQPRSLSKKRPAPGREGRSGSLSGMMGASLSDTDATTA